MKKNKGILTKAEWAVRYQVPVDGPAPLGVPEYDPLLEAGQYNSKLNHCACCSVILQLVARCPMQSRASCGAYAAVHVCSTPLLSGNAFDLQCCGCYHAGHLLSSQCLRRNMIQGYATQAYDTVTVQCKSLQALLSLKSDTVLPRRQVDDGRGGNLRPLLAGNLLGQGHEGSAVQPHSAQVSPHLPACASHGFTKQLLFL